MGFNGLMHDYAILCLKLDLSVLHPKFPDNGTECALHETLINIMYIHIRTTYNNISPTEYNTY